MTEEAPFLSRWSRRKAEVRGGNPVVAEPPAALRAPPVADPNEAGTVAAPASIAQAVPAEPAPPTLADVEQLDAKTGDFTRFVRPTVAPDVRNAALKKLFHADPHFNVMDGLDTYIDDYNKPDPLPAGMLRQMVQAQFLGLFTDEVTTEPLARRPELMATVQAWFEAEWPAYYGPGGPGDARADVLAYCNEGTLRNGLGLGLVALRDGAACGFAALKREPFVTHPQLSPWVGAAVVVPALRRQGIGRALLGALDAQARALGHTRIYCATATSASLLLRSGWRLMEQVVHEGEPIGIYERELSRT